MPDGGVAGDPWDSWVNPTSILGGVLAVCVCAYLAAVYLVWDARRLSDDSMVEYFRMRAVGAAVVAGAVAFVGIFVLAHDAEYLFDGLTSRALPARDPVSGVRCRLVGVVAPRQPSRRTARRRRCGGRRSSSAGASPSGTTSSPSRSPSKRPRRPSGTIGAVLVATVLAVLFIFPAIGFLFVLDQRGLLPEEERQHHTGRGRIGGLRRTTPRPPSPGAKSAVYGPFRLPVWPGAVADGRCSAWPGAVADGLPPVWPGAVADGLSPT